MLEHGLRATSNAPRRVVVELRRDEFEDLDRLSGKFGPERLLATVARQLVR
jgi:hypothetical protein